MASLLSGNISLTDALLVISLISGLIELDSERLLSLPQPSLLVTSLSEVQ